MLLGPDTVKLSNSSCTGELTWTLQNVSVMTILKRKQKKNSKEKIKRSFKTIRDKEVNHT